MATISWNSGYSASPTVKLTVTQSSQSIADNTSTISYKLTIERPSAIYSSASKGYKITINGASVSGTTTIGGSGTKTIRSGTMEIKHNNDGSKSINFSFNLDVEITWSGHYLGTASNNGSMTLSTIPRKSTLTVGNGTLGSSLSITINKAYNGFTSTLTYEVGSTSGTIASKTSSSAQTWIPSLSLSSQNKNGTSVSCTFTLTTYNDNTSIGSVQKTITLSIPTSVKPAITTVTDVDLQNFFNTYNNYIKNLSKIRFTISASGVYSSTIKKYEVTNSTLGTFTSSTNQITIDTLNVSGQQIFTLKVTDTRGRTATQTKTINILNYEQPTFNALKVYRTDEYGNQNDEGSYVLIQFDIICSNLNNLNIITLGCSYKKTSDAEYTITKITRTDDTQSGYNPKGHVFLIFSSDYSYDVKFLVNDNIDTYYQDFKVPTGHPLLNFNSSGLGIAMGKVSELNNYLDIDFNTVFRKDMYTNFSSDEKIKFHWQNNADYLNKTIENDNVYPHHTYFYGCDGDSTSALGLCDARLEESGTSGIIFRYNDYQNIVFSDVGWNLKKSFQSGRIRVDVSANSRRNFTISLANEMYSPPIILVNCVDTSGFNLQYISAYVNTITTTNFKLYVENRSNSSVTAVIAFIAHADGIKTDLTE